jgi:hypothetical protein
MNGECLGRLGHRRTRGGVAKAGVVVLACGLAGTAWGQFLSQETIGVLDDQGQGRPFKADPEPPVPQVVDTVHGVVVSSVDGKPIARALVSSQDRRMATLTDGEGRFSFEVSHPDPKASGAGTLPAGMSPQVAQSYRVAMRAQMTMVYLMAQRPGYTQQNTPMRLSFDKPEIPEVVLKLVPEGVLHGQLVVNEGEGPAGVQVQLLRKQVQDGLGMWQPMQSTQANSRGEFRFANLSAGDYKVMTRQYEERGFGGATEDREYGYAAAYSGDARDVASAAAAHVSAGQTAEVNLALPRATFYKVTIPTAGVPAGAGMGVQVGAEDQMFGSSMHMAGGQSVEGFVPDGQYDVRVTATVQPPRPAQAQQVQGQGRDGLTMIGGDGGNGQQQPTVLTGTMWVTVAGAAVRTIPLTLGPSGEIPVVVREEFTTETANAASSRGGGIAIDDGRRNPRVNVYLQQIGSFRQVRGTPVGGESEDLVLRGVPEGTYRMVVQPTWGYVASLQSHGTDLMRRPLVVGPGGNSDPIEVTLRDDNKATVTGTIAEWTAPADGANRGAFGTLVSLVPLDDLLGRSEMIAGSMDGTFTLNNVPPGEYLALASHGQVNLEFRDEEAMKRYAGKGTRVTVTAGAQKTEIQVPILDEVESVQGGWLY